MDKIDRVVINQLQGGFPIVERPFREAAQALGLTEEQLIAVIERLLAQNVLTRFGPLYNVERSGGAFTLAALGVPPADFERVAAILAAMPEVAHNYQREHALNMWFVLATETPDAIAGALKRIEEATGYRVIETPKLDEYFVGLQLAA